MIKKISRNEARYRRKIRIRKKIKGTEDMPRLCIYKSLKNLYCQIINDTEGKTILSLSSKNLNIDNNNSKCKKNKKYAEMLGTLLAEKAKEKGIKKVVFDRSGYPYHGKIKSFAEGARKGGLEF